MSKTWIAVAAVVFLASSACADDLKEVDRVKNSGTVRIRWVAWKSWIVKRP